MRATVGLKGLKRLPEADLRQERDPQHVKNLLQSIRNGIPLPPVTIWKDTAGTPWLIDGFHRAAAWRELKRTKVPAVVFRGTRAEAIAESVKLNTQHGLPLTSEERTDAAWLLARLMTEDGQKAALSKGKIAIAAGVGTTTVARMRTRWSAMTASGVIPTGSWWRDRKDQGETGGDLDPSVSQRMTQEIAEQINAVLLPYRRKNDDAVLDGIRAGIGRKLHEHYLEWHGADAEDRGALRGLSDEMTVWTQADDEDDAASF